MLTHNSFIPRLTSTHAKSTKIATYTQDHHHPPTYLIPILKRVRTHLSQLWSMSTVMTIYLFPPICQLYNMFMLDMISWQMMSLMYQFIPWQKLLILKHLRIVSSWNNTVSQRIGSHSRICFSRLHQVDNCHLSRGAFIDWSWHI